MPWHVVIGILPPVKPIFTDVMGTGQLSSGGRSQTRSYGTVEPTGSLGKYPKGQTERNPFRTRIRAVKLPLSDIQN